MVTGVAEMAQSVLSEHAAKMDLAGEGWTVLLPPAEMLAADETTKVVFRNQNGEPRGILICSSTGEPAEVAKAVAAAARAKELLVDEAGKAVLEPLASGERNGISYALFPWCVPLSDSRLVWPLQRRRLRPHLFGWLRHVVKTTLREPSPAEIGPSFLSPLEYVARCTDCDRTVSGAAQLQARRLEAGRWLPRFVLAHNDLWKGNILLRKPGRFLNWLWGAPFVIIDWAGAQDKGHALYDLVRLGDSMRLGATRFRWELREHCQTLGCEVGDAKGYVLAALGHVGMSSEQIPRDRYLRLVGSCCRRLFQALE